MKRTHIASFSNRFRVKRSELAESKAFTLYVSARSCYGPERFVMNKTRQIQTDIPSKSSFCEKVGRDRGLGRSRERAYRGSETRLVEARREELGAASNL